MAYLDQRPTVAKGRRPYFFDDPSIDKLLSILMALTGELSVMRERLDTHERLAEADLLPTGSNVEAYEVSDELRAARAEERAAFLKRVLRVISDELDRMKRQESGQGPERNSEKNSGQHSSQSSDTSYTETHDFD